MLATFILLSAAKSKTDVGEIIGNLRTSLSQVNFVLIISTSCHSGCIKTKNT